MAANVNGSNFDTTLEPAANTLGSVIITLGPGSGQFALAYLDYDLNFPNTGSFSDFGSVVGTPPSGVTYQLQDPNSGDLFAAFAANALTNQNNVATPGRPPDICCDVAWALGVGGLDVPAGGQAIITFTVSTTAPPTGFYLEQTNVMPDGSNGENIYLSETTQIEGTAAPEPGTLALLGGAAIAISLLRPHHTRRG